MPRTDLSAPTYTASRLRAGVTVAQINDVIEHFPGADDPAIREQLIRQYGGERQLAEANVCHLSEFYDGEWRLYEHGHLIGTYQGGLGRVAS